MKTRNNYINRNQIKKKLYLSEVFVRKYLSEGICLDR